MDTKNIPFVAADILIPAVPDTRWPVVACDQYTSEPEYWENADAFVGDAPSTLRMILPEVYLNAPDVDERICRINRNMNVYIDGGVFRELPSAMIYLKRTLPDGRVRHGLIGALDLEAYDYNTGSRSLIRATEGTVLSRIPPRVRVRENAPLELPHIMVLIDDPDRTVIEPLACGHYENVYSLPLMAGSGRIDGYLLDTATQNSVLEAMAGLRLDPDSPMLFAMGDGNHSLATAKECYERLKRAGKDTSRARYALVELVNIHDEALDFEPIYRVIFNVDTVSFISALKRRFAGQKEKPVSYVSSGENGEIYTDGMQTDVLQKFIDEYIASNGGSVDYIHGEDTVRRLSAESGVVGLIFGGITKSELFPYVSANGVLPRKTFSMGEAPDKRFYMECRRI